MIFETPTVLIFKESLLPISETFIPAQANALRRFQPRYVGLGRVAASLPIPSDSILLTSGLSATDQLRQKLYRRTGVAPTFHSIAGNADAALMHAHFASGGRSALPLARALRLPLLVTLHGSDVTTRVDFRARYAQLWREAGAFICISQFIRDKAIEAGFPEDRLRVHYIGIDLEKFQPVAALRDAKLVLFVGRLVEKKGCALLLHAMHRLRSLDPDSHLVVIGDGPLRPALTELSHQLGLACRFLGAQPAVEVRRWLSAARVFCAPSVTAPNGDSEGLGMVFAEAQSIGTPVASFRHGGIPEVVLDGETGLLADEFDVEGLAQNIHRLLNDDACWQSCQERGKAWIAERFDLQHQTHELEEVYQELSGVRRPVASTSALAAAIQ